MKIRTATTHDRNAIRQLNLTAFPEEENELVAQLAIDLLDEPQATTLVAESDGEIIGPIAFSPVTIVGNNAFRGSSIAPVAVKPDHQKQGIGSKLINTCIQQLSDQGVHVVFIYGDPKYYSRFGLTPEAAEPYTPPFKLQYPFGWQAFVLNEYSLPNPPAKITCVPALNNPALW